MPIIDVPQLTLTIGPFSQAPVFTSAAYLRKNDAKAVWPLPYQSLYYSYYYYSRHLLALGINLSYKRPA